MPQRFYEPFAQAMTEFGFAVLTVLTCDYRGIGASVDRPLSGDPATMTDWIDDAAAAHGWLANTLPQIPLLAVGHSLGGQFAAILGDERPADALVLVGAQCGYFGTFSPVDRSKLWLTWKLGVPALTAAFGYLPAWAGLGEDLRRASRVSGRVGARPPTTCSPSTPRSSPASPRTAVAYSR